MACGLFFGVFEWVKQQGYYYFIDEMYGIREDMALLKARMSSDYNAFADNITPNNMDDTSSPSGTTPPPTPPPPTTTYTAPPPLAERPYFLLEPTFVLLAGAAAAVAYQAVDYPLEQVKSIFYAKESERAAQQARLQPQAHTQHLNASSMRSGTSISSELYRMTWTECQALANNAGGWRRFLFASFGSTAIRAVPAASVGFLVFEVMKRKLDARRYEHEDREMASYLDTMMAEREEERRAEMRAAMEVVFEEMPEELSIN